MYKCSHALKSQGKKEQTFAFIFSRTFVKILIVDSSWCHALCNDSKFSKTFLLQRPCKGQWHNDTVENKMHHIS